MRLWESSYYRIFISNERLRRLRSARLAACGDDLAAYVRRTHLCHLLSHPAACPTRLALTSWSRHADRGGGRAAFGTEPPNPQPASTYVSFERDSVFGYVYYGVRIHSVLYVRKSTCSLCIESWETNIGKPRKWQKSSCPKQKTSYLGPWGSIPFTSSHLYIRQ